MNHNGWAGAREINFSTFIKRRRKSWNTTYSHLDKTKTCCVDIEFPFFSDSPVLYDMVVNGNMIETLSIWFNFSLNKSRCQHLSLRTSHTVGNNNSTRELIEKTFEKFKGQFLEYR